MDPAEELRDVAKRGDTAAFHRLLGNDQLLLEKATLSPLADNILHIASVAGNLNFVTHVLHLKPGFAWDGNKDGLTPLHMASALGHDKIVGEILLEVGLADHLCLLQDNQGRTPLHYAAINGKIPVIEMLLSTCPKALEIETSKGETALHLALKNKQAHASRLLVDRRLILKYRTSIQQLVKEINQPNQLQELNVLLDASPTSFRVRMERFFRSSFTRSIDPQIAQVVASLVVSVTFNAAVNPPPAIWDKDKKIDYKCLFKGRRSSPRQKPFSSCPAFEYIFFMLFNSLGFSSSVMVLLFVKTARVRQPLMALSFYALVGSYLFLLFAMSPDVYTPAITLFPSCLLPIVLDLCDRNRQ